MKNKTLKAIVAIILIIALTLADFMLLGMNLITYALENVDNSTGNKNVKFAAFFKTKEGVVDQTKYEMTDTEMKLYIQVAVENEGYFDGIITLGDSNFRFKNQKLSENIGKIEGNAITLNRVRAGNVVEIEVAIEPITSESYSEEMLNKQSVLSLSGNYTNSIEKTEGLSAEKKITLILSAPSSIDSALQANVITNRIYKIGDVNKRLVQLKINSTIIQNVYPIQSTNFEIELPDNVEIVEVISNGTYATNGDPEKQLQVNSDYTWNQTNNKLSVTILNNSQDGKISWKKDCEDTIIVTLILPEDTSLGETAYNINSQVKLVGTEEKTLTKETTYNLSKESDGTIRANIENSEIIYKGKIYSQEEKEYETKTNIEINYDKLIENTIIQEKSAYRTENKDKEANIEYKTTIITKAEIEKVLGQEGSLTIKNAAGEEIVKINKDTQADKNGEILITYPEGTKQIQVEIENVKELEGTEKTEYTGTTGIIRLRHTKVIKPEEYTRQEIKEFKYLVEQVNVKYSNIEYTFEKINQLKETTSSAVLTVIPQTISSEQSNEMQMAITLKTDKESYDLYKNPTFIVTMPEGVTVNSLSNQSISASDGGLTISKLQNNGTKEIIIEITGEQQKYITSEINTQINFKANVTLEKLMPNKTDTVKMQYTNQGETFETQSEKINLIASNDKIVTNLKVENYNGLGLSLEKYSDSANGVTGELPLDNKQIIEAPLKYTIVNNYNSAITLTGVIAATFTDKDGNQERLINYADQAITIEAGKMQTITQTLKIPAGLYYSETIDVETLAEYTYSGTTYKTHNNIKLITEEKEGIRDISIIDDKIQIDTFAQLGDGTGIEENDQVYNEQTISYIIEVTNISRETISNLKLTNTQDNGNIFDLKEVLMTNRVEEFIEHEYAELDTNKKIFEIETLKPGETKELICRVVVKKSQENNITTANISIAANGIEERNVQTISNVVRDAKLKIITKNALKEEVGTYADDSLFILTNIKNLTEQKLENIKIRKYMSQGIIYNKDCSVEVMDLDENELDILGEITYNEEEQYIEFTVTTLEAGQEIKILSSLHIKNLPLEQLSSTEIVYLVADDIISNNIVSNVIQLETALSVLQSVNVAEESKIKDGDTVIITGEVTNIGNVDTLVVINDELPDGLEITKVETIKENKVTNKTEDIASNYVSVSEELAVGDTATIKIYTKVNTSLIVTEEISNKISAVPEKGKTAFSNEVIIKIESTIDDSTEIGPDEVPEIQEPENKDPGVQEPDEKNPDDPDAPNNPDNPDDEEGKEPEKEKTYTISGYAWIDKNQNSNKENDETIKGITIKIIDLNNKNTFLKDSQGKDIEATTDENGLYELKEIPKGNYSLIFRYDTNVYELKENSELKDYIIESSKEKVAITNNIKLESDKNIDLELIEKTEFDLKIDKYISKVIVQTTNETKTSSYSKKQLVREEINRKYITGATILVEYTLEVSNIGELEGYATEIVDYLPSDMKFHSELNSSWYMGEDKNLYSTSLASTEIKPGETKTIKLVLLKTMNSENIGTTSNNAEIINTLNSKEYSDINLINNQSKAEIIVNPATGAVITYIIAVLNAIAIIGAGIYLINKKIVRKEQTK